MNGDIKLSEMLDDIQSNSWEQIDIVISNDCNGINAGSYLVRKSEWSEKFMEKWLSLMFRTDYDQADFFQEQAAFTELVRINYENANKHVKFVYQKMINSYMHAGCGHQYQNGDFVVHNAGFGYLGLVDELDKKALKEV